jgi:hypothetical protein
LVLLLMMMLKHFEKVTTTKEHSEAYAFKLKDKVNRV